MTPVLYALAAMVCYAMSNVLIERYFSRVEPLISVFIQCVVIAVISVACMMCKHRSETAMVLPTGYVWLIIILSGVICFFADRAYLTAYNSGGSVAQVTTIVATLPIFAVIMKSMVEMRMPSLTHFCGCFLATAAVYLVTR